MSKKRKTPGWGDEQDLPEGDSSLPPVPAEDWDPAQYATAAKPQPWRISHMMWLTCAIAFLTWLFVTVGLFVIVVGAVVLVTILSGTGMVLARQRSNQQDSLLWILAIAVERDMPLAPTLASFADQFRGAYRRRIMNLAAHLNWGTPLPEALEKVRRLVSRDAILMAYVGQETGRLPQALRTTASARSTQLPIWAAIASRFSYLLGLLLAIQAICAFLLYFIVPKFEAIFKDFGVSLPPVTILLIEGSHYLVRFGILSAWVPPLEIMLLLFLPFSFAGWINYDVPFFDRLLKRRHLALILRALALVVEAGKPIETGLSILASHYPTWWVRRKLIKANAAVRRGESWIEALWRQGLIRATDAEVLGTSAEVGNLAWAMRELSETSERRLTFRFQAVLQTIFPLVVVSIGVGVFFLAVAFFAPLTELIRRLAG